MENTILKKADIQFSKKKINSEHVIEFFQSPKNFMIVDMFPLEKNRFNIIMWEGN